MGVVDARWGCQTAVGVSKNDVHAGNARWYWRSPASIVRATAADIDSDEGSVDHRGHVLVEQTPAGPHDGEGPRPVLRRRRRTSCSSTTTGSSAPHHRDERVDSL